MITAGAFMPVLSVSGYLLAPDDVLSTMPETGWRGDAALVSGDIRVAYIDPRGGAYQRVMLPMRPGVAGWESEHGGAAEGATVLRVRNPTC